MYAFAQAKKHYWATSLSGTVEPSLLPIASSVTGISMAVGLVLLIVLLAPILFYQHLQVRELDKR